MATLNMSSKSNYSNYFNISTQKVNVLASCYAVDASGLLKGLHYSTTVAPGMFPRHS